MRALAYNAETCRALRPSAVSGTYQVVRLSYFRFRKAAMLWPLLLFGAQLVSGSARVFKTTYNNRLQIRYKVARGQFLQN